MIEYVEIRDKSNRELIGIIDTAKSIIWKSQYYGVGEFEVYAMATPDIVSMLVEGNYVTRANNFECGIIEHTEKTDDSDDGMMIIASGRFIKSILDRRVIYSATLSGTGNNYIWHCSANVLKGNVEAAIRKLISDNAYDCVDSNRNIDELYLTDEDITGLTEKIVVDVTSTEEESAEKQVTYKNLFDYSEQILKEYSLGAKMWLDRSLLKFRYKIYKGEDRSRNSEDHQPIIFSKEYDNLISSSYIIDSSLSKNTALIGGEGEGVDRSCAFAYAWNKGLDRREVFVDASSITSTYTEGEVEKTYTTEEYRKQLEAQGKQTISELQTTETFNGEIDLTNSLYVYGEDYNLGDIITIEDKDINKYIDTRILTVTEVQDDDGYKIEIEYGV